MNNAEKCFREIQEVLSRYRASIVPGLLDPRDYRIECPRSYYEVGDFGSSWQYPEYEEEINGR